MEDKRVKRHNHTAWDAKFMHIYDRVHYFGWLAETLQTDAVEQHSLSAQDLFCELSAGTEKNTRRHLEQLLHVRARSVTCHTKSNIGSNAI